MPPVVVLLCACLIAGGASAFASETEHEPSLLAAIEALDLPYAPSILALPVEARLEATTATLPALAARAAPAEGVAPSAAEVEELALGALTYLGAGYDQCTPNRHRRAVATALDSLRAVPVGTLDPATEALVLMALAEAYAMTNQPVLRASCVERLVALRAQAVVVAGRAIGWPAHRGGEASDARATCLALLALKSAQAGGLTVGPEPEQVVAALAAAQPVAAELVAYRAAALALYRNPAAAEPTARAIRHLLHHAPDPERLWLTTLAAFMCGGEWWQAQSAIVCHRVFRPVLEDFARSGRLELPAPTAADGHRVTLAAEVFYRYLPLAWQIQPGAVATVALEWPRPAPADLDLLLAGLERSQAGLPGRRDFVWSILGDCSADLGQPDMIVRARAALAHLTEAEGEGTGLISALAIGLLDRGEAAVAASLLVRAGDELKTWDLTVALVQEHPEAVTAILTVVEEHAPRFLSSLELLLATKAAVPLEHLVQRAVDRPGDDLGDLPRYLVRAVRTGRTLDPEAAAPLRRLAVAAVDPATAVGCAWLLARIDALDAVTAAVVQQHLPALAAGEDLALAFEALCAQPDVLHDELVARLVARVPALSPPQATAVIERLATWRAPTLEAPASILAALAARGGDEAAAALRAWRERAAAPPADSERPRGRQARP